MSHALGREFSQKNVDVIEQFEKNIFYTPLVFEYRTFRNKHNVMMSLL